MKLARITHIFIVTLLTLSFFLFASPNILNAVMPQHEKLSSITENLSKPQKVALDNNENIFVTVPKDNKILLYNAIGEYKKAFFGFQTPISIAVDNTNRIFVGNEASGNVVAYSLDNNGDLVQLFELGTGAGEFSKPSSIAIDGISGNIYVADMVEDVVKIYSSSGVSSGSFGTSGSGNGQFNKPVSIAIDEIMGEIMVLDRGLVVDMFGAESEGAEIQVFNMSGVFQRTFGTYGWDEGQMKRPQGIEIDESSRVYIIDSLFQFIYIFDNNGVYEGKISDVIEPIRSPMGIVIGGSERVFITSITRDKYDIYRVSDADSAYIEASPRTDDFAIVDVNSVSAARTVEVFNLGNLGFTLGSSTITGADASDFSIQSSNCSGTLGASSACTINVIFAPTVMGAKNASLEIPNDAPNEGTIVIPLTGTANDLPVAVIGGSSSGVEGQEIVFGGSGSTDSEGSITRYEWDVDGDGTYEYESATATQSHTYSANASYTVGLRVTDENNATNVETTIIDISDTAPTAAFSADTTTGEIPLTVTFSNTSSGYDAPLTYEWDFNNDGTVDSTIENPVINYEIEGTYTVSLKVRDSDNTTHTETKNDFIIALTADSDGDGIMDDGDGSGTAGDNTCTGGNTVNCDDNCVSTPNADQADADSDGVGDMCESCDPPVKIGSNYYYSIQSAYDAAADGSTILVQSAVYIDDIVFDDEIGQKSVTISGGYDCTYESSAGMSTLTGINMSINFGTVSLENIILE
ncbi:MAG: PKD domain-containing protein [Nitrospirota bacterium]